MQAIQRITIQATPPERISKLRALAGNLYWSWTPAAFELFREINPNVFDATHNPVRVLNECSQANLERVAHDPAFLERFDAVIKDFEAYMGRQDTWYAKEVSSNFLKLFLEGEGQQPSPPYLPPQPPQGGQNFDPVHPIILVLHDAWDFTLR